MHKGATLLITVIILMTIMVSFAVVGSRAYINQLTTDTSTINKKRADALADACVDEAIYQLGTNGLYTGNETIVVGAESCAIRPIISSGGTWTIEVQGSVGGVTSRGRVTLGSRVPPTISAWEWPNSW